MKMRRHIALLAAAALLWCSAAQAAYIGAVTQFGVVVGGLNGALGSVTPGSSGIPLTSQGASANPSFAVCTVVGGCTGLATLTANAVVVGAGTSNVHLVGSSSTADSVLAWGAAGADPATAALTSCSAGTSALTYNTSTHAFGCNTLTASGVPLTTATAAGGSPITIAATNGLTTIVSMGTPAAATINLPTAVQTNGFRLCVKDGTTNWATNNATIKSPTAGTIDGVAGATGIVANVAHQELCFISDTVNWFIE